MKKNVFQLIIFIWIVLIFNQPAYSQTLNSSNLRSLDSGAIQNPQKENLNRSEKKKNSSTQHLLKSLKNLKLKYKNQMIKSVTI